MAKRRSKPKDKKPKTYSKYRSVRTEVDGIKFQSKVEAHRYIELKRREANGDISDIKLQPRYKIKHPVTDKLICTYVADFRYKKGEDIIVEDVKGVLTDVFKLKTKMARMLKAVGPDGEEDDFHVTIVKSVRASRGVYVWSADGVVED